MMEPTQTPTQTVSYMECNIDVLMTAAVVVVMMVIFVIYVRIVVTGDIAHAANKFYPPAFFLGDTDKQRIQSVKDQFINGTETEEEEEEEEESALKSPDPWWTVAWRHVRRGLLHIESSSHEIAQAVQRGTLPSPSNLGITVQ